MIFRKTAFFLLILMLAAAGMVVHAEDEEKYVNSEILFEDTMDDWGRMYEYDGPWAVKSDESNPDDLCKMYRLYDAPAFIKYKSTRPITGFYLKVYRRNAPVETLRIYLSKDNENWVEMGQKIETAPGTGVWYYNYITQSGLITEDYYYMKVTASDDTSGYSPQIFHLEYYTDGITSRDEIVEEKVVSPIDLAENKQSVSLFVNDGSMTAENLAEPVTRGEFADIVAKISRLTSGGGRSFSDVFVSHAYYNSILAVAEAGYMNGFVDGRFMPDEALTYEQAYTVCSKMMGYYSETGGNRAALAELELSRGIDEKKPLTKDVLSKILWNAVHNPKIEYVLKDGEYKLAYSDEEFLQEVMGIVEIEGVITATDYGSIAGEVPQSGSVCINTIPYSTKDMAIHEFLGYSVEVCVYEDAEDEILSYYISDDNNSYKIEGRDIESVEGKRICFTDSNGKEIKKNLDAEFYAVNGQRSFSATNTTILDMAGKDGYVVIIDSDGDNSYETVLIYDFVTYVVEGVDAKNMIITDKFGLTPLKLDEDAVITESGERIEFTALQSGDIVSAAISDGYKILNVSRRKTKGKINAVSEGQYTIGNNSYYMTHDLERKQLLGTADMNYIKTGIIGEFYLDFMGNIAYIIVDDLESSYAFLIRAFLDDSDENIILKIFNGKEVKDYNCGAKITIDDGNSSRSYMGEDALRKLTGANATAEQLLFCKFDSEGAIKSISVAQNTKNDVKFSCDYLNENANVANGNIIDLKYAINKSTTKIFVVPYDRSLSEFGSEIVFINSDTATASDDQNYDIELFDTDDMNIAKAAVVYLKKNYGASQNLSYAALSVVSDIAEVYDAETGSTRTVLNVITNKAEKQYFIAESFAGVQNTDTPELSSLKRGDVLRVGTNGKGEASKIEMIYDTAHRGTTSSDSTNYTASGKFVNGNGAFVLIEVDGKDERIYSCTSARVTVVEKGDKTVTVGTVLDLRKDDTVVIYSYKQTANDIVIIRED